MTVKTQQLEVIRKCRGIKVILLFFCTGFYRHGRPEANFPREGDLVGSYLCSKWFVNVI